MRGVFRLKVQRLVFFIYEPISFKRTSVEFFHRLITHVHVYVSYTSTQEIIYTDIGVNDNFFLFLIDHVKSLIFIKYSS